MNENEKLIARIHELEVINASHLVTIQNLDSVNRFLREIIDKLIENGKN